MSAGGNQTKTSQNNCNLVGRIVKRFTRFTFRPASRLAARFRRLACVSPGRCRLGLAGYAAKYLAYIDFLVAMGAFVVCFHLVFYVILC